MKEFIKNNILTSKKILEGVISKKFPNEYKEIIRITSFLDNDVHISQRIYHIMNDLENIPKCNYCRKNNVAFKSYNRGYAEYCSRKCTSRGSKQKIQNTCLKKYGVKNPFQSEKIKEDIRKTNREKYGVDNPSQSEIIKEIKVLSSLKKYGVKNPFQSEKIKEDIRKTNREKYGVNYFLETKIPHETVKHNKRKKTYYNILEKCKNMDISLMTSFDGFSKSGVATLKCKNNHVIHINHFSNFFLWKGCPQCSNNGISYKEKEISDFITSKNYEIITNCKKIISPYEIDMYIPSLKVGIEFNGLYWHSEENGKGKKYHVRKTDLCKDRGIRLIHIFEDEWDYKRDIVKSVLLNVFGEVSNKIYARKCEVSEENGYNECQKFLTENHLQGAEHSSSIRISLRYNGDIVSLMTFGKRKLGSSVKFELLRFCNKVNTTVIGGASKLFRYFLNNFTSDDIISYSDRRWFDGSLYDELGFDFSHISEPNYWYIKNGERFNRINFQKHKISDDNNNDKTEYEIMSKNGYSRIWDCGSKVFVYRR